LSALYNDVAHVATRQDQWLSSAKGGGHASDRVFLQVAGSSRAQRLQKMVDLTADARGHRPEIAGDGLDRRRMRACRAPFPKFVTHLSIL